MGETSCRMSESPRRVVLDTNVVTSALLFPGPTTAQIRQAWMRGALIPLVCRETTLELVRVLAYPRFALTRDEQAQLLADYLPWCEVVDDLAIAGTAAHLVTGDRALLELNGVDGLHVATPAELLLQSGVGGSGIL
jgi:predicted nucleic acid-binding protein